MPKKELKLSAVQQQALLNIAANPGKSLYALGVKHNTETSLRELGLIVCDMTGTDVRNFNHVWAAWLTRAGKCIVQQLRRGKCQRS